MALLGQSPLRSWRLSGFLLAAASFLLTCFILYLLVAAMSPGHLVSVKPPESDPQEDEEAGPSLTLARGDAFKLVIFSDLHYGEEEHGWGIDQDSKSGRVMRSVLADEGPDFVVVNGDLITGENTFRENASDYVHQVFAPMVERNMPWASTYGNHDSKFNLSRETSYAAERTYRLSLTRQMDSSLPGVTNYYVLLYKARPKHMASKQKPRHEGHEDDNADKSAGVVDKPVAVLWFFDSRGGAAYQDAKAIAQDNIDNWVPDATAAWFHVASARLRARYGRLHGLAFVHIPPDVFLAAQQAGLDPRKFPGVNDDVPLAIQGDAGARQDGDFVDALRAEDMLHSVFVGHDHGNAWCGLWPEEEISGSDAGGNTRPERPHNKKPFLCFGKHTGYGGYGTWRRGARVVHLAFVDRDGDGDYDDRGEMRVQTWVRMEDGQIVTRVDLNETYGVDAYPTANGEPGS